MIITTCLGTGLAGAWRRPKLVALMWAWNLALAAGTTLPLAAWLRDALSFAPEGDLLAHRYSLGLMSELFQEAGPARGMVWAGVMGALLLGFLASPLLAGGMLEALQSRDDRSFLHRFFRGGGHFYGRFLRLAAISTAVMAVVAGAVGLAAAAALTPLRESGWEPGNQVARLLALAAAGAVVTWFWLALDYARIQVSRDDSRRMFRAFRAGLGFTLRYRGRTFGLLALGWLLLLALGAGYVAFRQLVPSHTAGLIALMVAVQQAFMLLRMGLRVGMVAAHRELHLALRPAVGLAVTTAAPELSAAPPEGRPVEELPAELAPHPAPTA